MNTLQFPPVSGDYLVSPIRAIDGDTVEFNWTMRGVVRLSGINAPEHNQPGGTEARDYLAKQLNYDPAGHIMLRITGKDKFGRMLGELWAGTACLNKIMVETGHAVAWDGKGAKP